MEMKKNTPAAIVLSVLAVSLIANAYFFVEILTGKARTSHAIAKREEEFKIELANTRESVKKDIQGAQIADTVSLEVMGKRLEAEKNKVKELEEKLRSITKNGQ